jgi:cytochrome P450
MSAQPVHYNAEPRVACNPADVLAALSEPNRRLFRQELMAAGPDEIGGVLRTWWGHAMLDTDPARHQLQQQAVAGTLPVVSMADVLERRRAKGLPVE